MKNAATIAERSITKIGRAYAAWIVATAVFLSPDQLAHSAPSESAFTAVPSRFQTETLTVGSRGLGEICLGRNFMPDGTVCNPAFLGEQTENTLMGRGFLGNGYTAIVSAHHFLFKTLSRDFLESLFKNQQVTSLEANTGLVFTGRYLSASFSPYRLQYVSEVHNPNFPVVAVHAALERQLEISGGFAPWDARKDWRGGVSLGLKSRVFYRQYVHGSFSLAQVLIDDPNSLLPPQQQRGFSFNPGVAWNSRDLVRRAKFRASLGLKNLGASWPANDLYPENPDIESGVGAEIPLSYGTLIPTLDFVDWFRGDTLLARGRLGLSYRIGMLEPMIGVNARALTLGAQFGISLVQGGIVYEMFRQDFSGRSADNRIATELSIRI